ncbi:MAG: C25 family cysteine peptidase [Phycisphaerales bacterium]|nr:C25 family cysteine peptidase [Phycisphaerales bacterium]
MKIEKRWSASHVKCWVQIALVTIPVVLWASHAEASGPGTGKVSADALLVIAPEAFRNELADFVQFKQSRLRTRLVMLEDVVKAAAGADDAERLKRFIYDQWQENRSLYVLLVGDVDVLPMRYMVLDRCTTAAFDYAFYASDLYYADVARADGTFDDWNAQKDGFHGGYIGEVRGEKNKTDPINFDQVSYDPELAVGRWPVSTAAEVSIVAAKSMAYETGVETQNKPGLKTAALLCCGGWVDARDALDESAARLPEGWESEKRYYADAARDDRTGLPDAAQAVELLNSGVGVMAHIGHGFNDGWAGSLTLNDLPNVENADRLPVMISAGCGTGVCTAQAPYEGYIDIGGREHVGTNNGQVFAEPPPAPACYQRAAHNPSSMGEQMVRQKLDGAVAYIGCNTGGQPCAITLVRGFLNAIAQIKRPRLGDCWNAAVRYYIEHEHLATIEPDEGWYPPSVFYQPMKYMVYGDPSLPMPGVQ